MGHQPTFKSLIRINLLATGVICSVCFIFLLIAKVEIVRAVFVSVMGAVIILVIGIGDIYVLGFKPSHDTYITLTRKQRKLRYLLSYALSPFIYLFIWILFEPVASDHRLHWTDRSFMAIIVLSSWLMNTFIILLYHYNFLQQAKIQSEFENLELKAIISETANQVLKQQIHPHFLFNVLNTVKTLYKQDVRQGETYLVHLANFLRASLSNPAARIVRLEDELQLCWDYIEMQRVRFGKALTYQADVPLEIARQKYVPHFSLQALLENAIKHNDLTEESPLNIQIVVEGDYIKVINNLQSRHFKEPSTGQGLPNLAERYRLLSGDEIHITQTETCFAVRIKLLDDEGNNHRGRATHRG